jgi:large subunit ribosomal protein L35Ae
LQLISNPRPKKLPKRLNQLGKVSSFFDEFIRLYVKGVFTGFKRGHTTQHEKTALLRIKGVNQRKDAAYYFGRRVAYIFKGKNIKNNTKYRVHWGVVSAAHGNNG